MPPAVIKKIIVLSLTITVTMGLYSCGKPDIRQTTSRIAARVNGEEVSIHQIDSVFARNSNMTPERAGRAAVLARERIIDQELLVQEALEAKLNRDAEVAQAIERARRQILAQAYIERTVSSASQASAAEISHFYEENPALFEQRRIYRVLELVVVVPPERSAAFQDAVAGKKNLAEVVRWLDSQKLPFDTATTSRAAEQIPMNVLSRLSGMHDGQIAVFPTPHGVSVVRLEQSAAAPLSENQAAVAIARYLHNRKRLELAQAEITKLRERAKIDYDGIGPVRATRTAGRVPVLAGSGMTPDRSDFAGPR